MGAIWLSPIYPSPDDDLGYDISVYRAIDPRFGTLEDFDRLLAALHDHDIRPVLDLVPNHTSDRHPWFLESRSGHQSPRHDWYVWRESRPDGSPPNNWESYFGGPAWHFVSLPASGTCTRSTARSPTSTGRTSRCGARCRTSCGSGSIEAWTGSGWTWLAAGRHDAVVSHESALDLLGLSDVVPDEVHLTLPRTMRYRPSTPGVTVHTTTRPLGAGDVVIREGIRVSSAVRSILDAAEAGTSPEQIVAAIREALDRGMTTRARVSGAARSRSKRVQRLIRRAIAGESEE